MGTFTLENRANLCRKKRGRRITDKLKLTDATLMVAIENFAITRIKIQPRKDDV